MGGVHTKSCKHDEAKPPRRRDYRVESGRRFSRADRFKELLDIETALGGLSASDEGRMRVSSPCLSMTTCQSKQPHTELKAEAKESWSSSSTSQYTQSLNRQKHSSVRESPMNAIGNLRHTFMLTSNIKQPKSEFSEKLELTDSKSDAKLFNIESYKSQKKSATTQSTTQDDHFHSGDSRKASAANSTKASNGLTNFTQQPRSAKLSSVPSMTSMKVTPKSTEAVEPSGNLHTGDVQPSLSPKLLRTNSKSATYTETPYLAEKPPTPPPKAQIFKAQNLTFRNGYISQRPSVRRTSVGPNACHTKGRQTPSPLMQKRSPPTRANSLPRPSTADQWLSVPPGEPASESPARLRRSGSTSQNSETEVLIEKPQCLSRIEYTFYITDTEAYQRPFYDRRVEAIARASQCNICLHKPPPGHKPVYYKGIRVLPVTISARTMVTLKRCIARLDMQYPYFNVKAFCPPDMY
ncbi:hypothetical protein EG68_05059 [Paragonimus skrjabini miyazakii]|uniref:Uncharacterized protein n=1 Tax=Paragonimus skrjabini miyazakii TaxID=59628 RepID=A0A8S9YV27_9TREM|nr:hypothetical protein EG68_05059 [Paragonimus skrjabini miyazakii]